MVKPEFAIIVAMDCARGIGFQGDMPWPADHVPEDLVYFKEKTLHRPVIMGRKTYESIVERIGRPLPKRLNYVVTRQKDYHTTEKNVIVVDSLETAVHCVGLEVPKRKFIKFSEPYIIGGAEIYRQALRLKDADGEHVVQRLEITDVHGLNEPPGYRTNFLADTFFPRFVDHEHDWEERIRVDNDRCSFVTYCRK